MRASNFGERQLAGLDLTRLRTILVATDLSTTEHPAVQRAAQLAHAHGAGLKLMAMPPRGQAMPADAAQRLADIARELDAVLDVRVGTVPLRCHKMEDLVAQATGADLVVLPHRRARTAAFFRGQPVLRVLRGAGCPVLVVRGAGESPYRRILVGVDFAPESQALVKFAAHLEPQASVQLMHAVGGHDEARLRAADVLEDAVLAFRERSINEAWERMFALADGFEVRTKQLLAAVGYGEPSGQLVQQQERSGADLVVVGKKPSPAWSDFLGGSVAHRVLSWSTGDVLVVPLRRVRNAGVVPVRLPSDLDALRPAPALEARHERA